MSLTTIPIQQKTRDKLRQIAKKSESWDKVINRLYENEISRINAEVFFSSDTLSLNEALKEIEKW
jgi:predicted CopG family antitoxin